MDDLEAFIAYATKELNVELEDDDYEGLLNVMRVLNEVRAKQDAGTDTMFEPLRDIIDVLKEYGVEFSEETYEQVTIYVLIRETKTLYLFLLNCVRKRVMFLQNLCKWSSIKFDTFNVYVKKECRKLK